MSENKKQSIIDKINEMKEKKKQTDNEKLLKKVSDIIERSNDKSKLKIKWSNSDYSMNKVMWVMSSKMKSFNLFDSNETILLLDTDYKEVVRYIDNEFVGFWDNDNVDLEDIYISMEIYEDNGNEEVDIFKKKVICENMKLLNFCMVSGMLDMDSDTEEEENDCCFVGNTKQLLINQYVKYMVKLEKLKMRESEMEEKCVCDCCEESMKELTIKYTGYENRDMYSECSNDIELEVKKE